jgi:signal transduction histidine kinase
MEKTKEELLVELEELKQKFSDLESKHNEEISKYKNNEEDLRLKLLFLEGIANSSVEGFLVVNPYGQKILQNQRTIELWKIPQEVVNDPDGIKQVNHVMGMTINPQKFVDEIKYQMDHPNDKTQDELELIDGTVLERYSSPVIDSDGKNHGRIYTFHDVTERKNLERNLVQLNSDKDQFISILAHDLRSPFSGILGFSEMLKKNIYTYSLEKIEKQVSIIYETAKKTYELLEDTLLWASSQSKNITYNPTLNNLPEIVNEVIEILEPIAKVKKINLSSSIKEKLLVNTDIYMLKAILRNLFSNAIKFSREKGNIEISAKHNNSVTEVKISDNGIGMRPETLKKLFTFDSIQSTKGTANEKGTGMGLLLCKEFVEKHGGKIWVESEVDKGTTVTFSIPD